MIKIFKAAVFTIGIVYVIFMLMATFSDNTPENVYVLTVLSSFAAIFASIIFLQQTTNMQDDNKKALQTQIKLSLLDRRLKLYDDLAKAVNSFFNPENTPLFTSKVYK